MSEHMKPIVVDGRVLYIERNDYHSGNGFAAAKRLNQNRRTKIDNGVITNDTPWMMRILPLIAEYFGLQRNDVLRWWMEDFGVATMMQMRKLY